MYPLCVRQQQIAAPDLIQFLHMHSAHVQEDETAVFQSLM